jgi:membrane-associated phospholipid phosphatase
MTYPASNAEVAMSVRRERRLLVFALACLAFFGVLYGIAVRTAFGQKIDNAAIAGRTTRASVLRATDHLLNTISLSSLVVVGGIILLIALLRGRPYLAFAAAAVIGGSNLTTELLKHDILGRPALDPNGPVIGPLAGPSFPSGHTTVAMSLALGLVLVVPARGRPAAAVGGFAYAALVGVGVVTAAWHRPSDVVGAYLVVTAWAAVAAAALLAWRGLARVGSGPRRRVGLVSPLFAGVGLALLGIGFVGSAGALVAVRENELNAVRLDEVYAAAMTAIVGVGLVLVAAFLSMLRGVRLDPTPADQSRP